MIVPQKREACKGTTTASPKEDDCRQCEEETIINGEVDTTMKRDDVLVQRVLEAEPVANTSIEDMAKKKSGENRQLQTWKWV